VPFIEKTAECMNSCTVPNKFAKKGLYGPEIH
jgi:hypothetical protein